MSRPVKRGPKRKVADSAIITTDRRTIRGPVLEYGLTLDCGHFVTRPFRRKSRSGWEQRSAAPPQFVFCEECKSHG